MTSDVRGTPGSCSEGEEVAVPRDAQQFGVLIRQGSG